MFLRLTLFEGNSLIPPISPTIEVCPPPSPIEIVCRPLEVWRSIKFPVPAYASTDAEESSGRFSAKVFLQKNHYASWEYLVRIPKTRSHGNHYLSDSNWRKNPCAEYFGGKPSWMLFCTGNVFRKTVPRLFHLRDLKPKSGKTNNNIKKQWSQIKI